jgi:hypothetical protein
MRTRFFGVVLAVVTGCAGDDGPPTTDSGTTPTEALDIVGAYVDDFDTAHEITETTWTQTYPGYDPLTFAISQWGDDWLVAQNGADNAYSADLWSRFDWVWEGGVLYVCQSAYDAVDEDAAVATPAADGSDLDAGCGGFPFSALTPVTR